MMPSIVPIAIEFAILKLTWHTPAGSYWLQVKFHFKIAYFRYMRVALSNSLFLGWVHISETLFWLQHSFSFKHSFRQNAMNKKRPERESGWTFGWSSPVNHRANQIRSFYTHIRTSCSDLANAEKFELTHRILTVNKMRGKLEKC